MPYDKDDDDDDDDDEVDVDEDTDYDLYVRLLCLSVCCTNSLIAVQFTAYIWLNRILLAYNVGGKTYVTGRSI